MILTVCPAAYASATSASTARAAGSRSGCENSFSTPTGIERSPGTASMGFSGRRLLLTTQMDIGSSIGCSARSNSGSGSGVGSGSEAVGEGSTAAWVGRGSASAPAHPTRASPQTRIAASAPGIWRFCIPPC